MPRKETVREFINKRSSGAWITFEFDVDKVSPTVFKQYRCISVEDFLVEYGRRSSYILDDYVVISTKESYPSNSQGQTIWMTLQKKSDYVETLEPVKLTPFEVEDIIKKLENVKIKLNDYASGYEEAARDIDSIIKRLEE
jgi:hypothetical protein